MNTISSFYPALSVSLGDVTFSGKKKAVAKVPPGEFGVGTKKVGAKKAAKRVKIEPPKIPPLDLPTNAALIGDIFNRDKWVESHTAALVQHRKEVKAIEARRQQEQLLAVPPKRGKKAKPKTVEITQSVMVTAPIEESTFFTNFQLPTGLTVKKLNEFAQTGKGLSGIRKLNLVFADTDKAPLNRALFQLPVSNGSGELFLMTEPGDAGSSSLFNFFQFAGKLFARRSTKSKAADVKPYAYQNFRVPFEALPHGYTELSTVNETPWFLFSYQPPRDTEVNAIDYFAKGAKVLKIDVPKWMVVNDDETFPLLPTGFIEPSQKVPGRIDEWSATERDPLGPQLDDYGNTVTKDWTGRKRRRQ